MGQTRAQTTTPASTSPPHSILTIAWREKPPHQYRENGQEKGLLLELTKKVMLEAQIPHRFVEEPAKRIWQNFRLKLPQYCSFGWYKIAERESLVQFSDAMYRDPPHTLLVSGQAIERVSQHKHIKTLLSDPQLSLAIVDGVSYGEQLDLWVKGSQNKHVHVTATPGVVARMLSANRASMMFIDREDWHFLRSHHPDLRDIKQVDLDGMPDGLDRYIVCSKDVAPELMKKINQALARHVVPRVKAE